MTDARLGLVVDSSSVATAIPSLDKLTAATLAADTAVQSLATGSVATAGAVQQVGRAVVAEDEALKKATVTGRVHEAVTKAQTQALMQYNTQARAANLNTGNIAAQFQDIGVTAAMGMSPLMIALQQGTQLSAVLGGQGLRGVISSLGAAFMSIINPVSLLTIGFVALAAAGIQWAGGLISGTGDATDKLKEHRKWLDSILVGYDNAAEAAQRTYEQANKLPQGAAASLLVEDLEKQAQAMQAIEDRIQGSKAGIAEWIRMFKDMEATAQMTPGGEGGIAFAPSIAQLQQLRDLNVTTESTVEQLNAAATAARAVYDVAEEPDIKNMANDVYRLAIELRNAKLEAQATENALRSVQNIGPIDISIRTNMSNVESAMERLRGHIPDLRSDTEKIDDDLKAAVGLASSVPMALQGVYTSQANALAQQAKAGLEAKKAMDEAAKAATGGAKEADQLAESYQRIVDSARERIAQSAIEQQALGMSEEAALRLRYAHDLLTQAQREGASITPAQRQELAGLADEMARAEMQTRAMTKAQRENEQITNTLAKALGSLFSKPLEDANEFFATVLSGFASLGQQNLSKLFSQESLNNIFNGGTTNSAGGTGAPTSALGVFEAIRSGAEQGTEKGASNGLSDLLKSIPGGSGTVSAGLGGLGIGAQTANPLMGALGGALSGFAAGGPLGALVGGLGGLIGGLFGMSEEAKKARKALEDLRPRIKDFYEAALGIELGPFEAALRQIKQQAEELVKVARAAGDEAEVAKLRAAAEAFRGILGKEFLEDVQRSINSLRGNDFLNDVIDAQDRYNQRLKDAKTLGVSAAGALTEFQLSILEIAKDADLTTAQVNGLISKFPFLRDEILRTRRQIEIEAQQAKVDEARANYIDALKRERDALSGVIEQTRNFINSTQQYRNGLKLDSTLSTLAPKDQLAEAQRQFDAISRAARLGDVNAQGQLQGAATSYLDAARGYYGSSAGYTQIMDQVDAMLGSILGSAQTRLSGAEAQLAALNKQITTLEGINESVLTVAQALRILQQQIARLDALQAAQLKATNDNANAQSALAKSINVLANKR